METIEINNPFESEISSELIKRAAKGAIAFLKDSKIVNNDCDFELSIALVGKEKIAEINQKYREKSESTDVLSFCYDNDSDNINGEIILCPEEIEKNAKNDRIETEMGFSKNVVHGILHIVGFEHGQEMSSIQNKMLSQ